MKKKFLISALLAVSILFNGMTAFAEGENDSIDIDENYLYDEYTDEYIDDEEEAFYEEEAFDEAETIDEIVDEEYTDYDDEVSYPEMGKDYFTQKAVFITENIYLCDETNSLPQTHIDAIRRQLEKTYQTTHNNIAVYIGAETRTSHLQNHLAAYGVDTIFSDPGKVTHVSNTTIIDTAGIDPDGTLFLYIDTQGSSCIIRRDSITERYYTQSDLDSLTESLNTLFYGKTQTYITNITDSFCNGINELRTINEQI